MTKRRAQLATTLRWIGVIGISAIAILRCLTLIAPEVYFDVDPALDPLPIGGIGPAGSLALDVLLLLACVAGLSGERLAGRGADTLLVLLALLPLPVILWHGAATFGDQWRGSTWLAAVCAAITVAHLARDEATRMTLAALLLAVVAPLAIRGMSQVIFEHAETIATFEAQKEAFFRDRGWEPDSPSAQIYERRLRQPQPLGWFATTNIFASVMLAGVTVGAAFALGAWRKRLPGGWAGLMILIAAVSAAGILLSGSKGAILIMIFAACLVLLPLALPPIKAALRRYGPGIFIALPLVVLLGVVVRGALLPEGFLNDRSLLFRWHYLVSSAGIFADSPWLGTGPDAYQQAHMQHRLPRNPEEVTSSHSMFIDWLSMLGILGAAWITMTFVLLRRAGAAMEERATYFTGGDMEDFMRRLAIATLAIVLIAGIPALMFELHTLDGLYVFMRTAGLAAFIGVAMALGYVMLQLERDTYTWPLAAAAAAIVMHGQVEMTFHQPGFVVWGMAMLGLAGSARIPSRPNGRAHVMAIAIFMLFAVWTAWSGTLPASRQQSLIRHAAAALHPPAEDPAGHAEQRVRAAQLLVQAHDALPRNPRPLQHAARQLERAAMLHQDARRVELLEEAHALADRAVRATEAPAAFGLRAALAIRLAAATGDPEWQERAIDDATNVAHADPRGILPWQRLGDLLWMAGRKQDAVEAYRRALEADENFSLDPLKQLAERDRRTIEARLRELEEN